MDGFLCTLFFLSAWVSLHVIISKLQICFPFVRHKRVNSVQLHSSQFNFFLFCVFQVGKMLLKDVENMKEGEEELKMDLKEMGYSTVEQALLHMMKRVEVEGKGCKNLALTFRLPGSGAGDQASRGWRGPGIKPLRLWVQLQGMDI